MSGGKKMYATEFKTVINKPFIKIPELKVERQELYCQMKKMMIKKEIVQIFLINFNLIFLILNLIEKKQMRDIFRKPTKEAK